MTRIKLRFCPGFPDSSPVWSGFPGIPKKKTESRFNGRIEFYVFLVLVSGSFQVIPDFSGFLRICPDFSQFRTKTGHAGGISGKPGHFPEECLVNPDVLSVTTPA
jgi:hypothetical protein